MLHDNSTPAPDGTGGLPSRYATDTERARAALYSIPPDLPHDEWVKVGMAAHSAGLSFDDFDTWCAQAGPPIYSPADCTSTWRSFDDKPGGIGPGTLFFMAKQHGWRDDGAIQPQRKRPAEAPSRPPKPQSSTPPRAMAATEVWATLRPILPTVLHPYIFEKQAGGVPVDNLRIVPPGAPVLRLQPAVAGYLAVPVFNAAGALQSLQFIPPPGQGKKLNLRFSAITGGRHVVGEIRPDEPVYLCEGIGQAWACWQAKGHASACCFGWGNVAAVARQMRNDNPAAALVVVVDVGKESAAQTLAREVNAALVYMPQDKPSNYDAGNYARDFSITELATLLENPQAPPPAPSEAPSNSETFGDDTSDNKPAQGIKLVSVCDVFTNPSPPPAFVWGELVPRGEVTVFAAHGGVGKSTVALMLCDAVATGMPLFGIHTQQARALFASAEDGAPIVRHRLAAIARGRGANPADWGDALQAVDITDRPELYESDGRSAGATTGTFFDLSALIAGAGFGLVVIDNASDVYGGDEIQRRPVRTFLRHLKKLASENNCAVLLLVHVDKATSRGKGATGGEAYSGSTAWHNTARSRLFLSRDDSGMLKLEHLKSNLGRKQEPLTLQWPDGGLPMLATESRAVDFSGLTAQAQGRNDDNAAAALLKLIAEFESRGQFAAPSPQARNNVHALLRSESAFKVLGLTQDDTKRIVNQCQRAGWLAPLEYRTSDRKNRERWTVTEAGRAFSGLFAPTAPTAPTY